MSVENTIIHPPMASDLVFKDECQFTFQTPELPGGLNVCLHCYQAFAPADPKHEQNFTYLHYTLTGHSLFLNIQKFFQKEVQQERLQKRLKLDKVQILQENEDDYYTSQYELIDEEKSNRYPLSVAKRSSLYEISNDNLDGNIKSTIIGILTATSMKVKNDIEAWEQEIKPCKHSKNLTKFTPENYQLPSKCGECDLEENLWLCLHCGNIGCGRQQFGGLAGNSHALSHFDSYKDHPVAVKLGSLSIRDGKADCYCYSCNDEVKVPNLGEQLQSFGINTEIFEGKEKTLTELNIQQNLTWQFSMETEKGELLKPIFGKSLVGLKNLGNSCYINSTIQVLSHLQNFVNIFYDKDILNFGNSLDKPYNDLYLQLIRIFNGMVSDTYSVPSENSTDDIKWQKGLSLTLFKSLIGKSNSEFKSEQQQDAFEFILFFLDQIEKYYFAHAADSESSSFKSNPVDFFKFVSTSKLSDIESNKFKLVDELQQYISVPLKEKVIKVDEDGTKHYEPNDLKDCIKEYFEFNEILEIGNKQYNKKVTLSTGPEVLLIQAQRATLVNWVPVKVNVPAYVSNEEIDLSEYLVDYTNDRNSPNLIKEEEEEEEEEEEKNTHPFTPNQNVMDSLLQMGFPEPRCIKALYSTDNSNDPEVAMNWLFAHMDDADIDTPINFSKEKKSSQNPNEPTEGEINNLVIIGFQPNVVRKALILNNKNPEAAIEWLFNNPGDDGVIEEKLIDVPSFSTNDQIKNLLASQSSKDLKYRLKAVVCHKGSSIHTGHYVSYIKQKVNDKAEWVLYNDEKVVVASDKKSMEEMSKNGYLYVFVKKGGIDDDFD